MCLKSEFPIAKQSPSTLSSPLKIHQQKQAFIYITTIMAIQFLLHLSEPTKPWINRITCETAFNSLTDSQTILSH